jgi:uncharacterized membrane protein YdfJ with MMPL/SSD domain
VPAHVKGDETQAKKSAEHLIDTYSGTYRHDLTVTSGGGAAVSADLSKQVVSDLFLAEAIAIPLTLLLLLFVFGSVVAALLPLAVATIAILGSFAELSLLDAVAIRGVLVPAAMRLLGRSAWYAPGFLRRVHGRIGLSENGPAPAAAQVPEPAARP